MRTRCAAYLMAALSTFAWTGCASTSSSTTGEAPAPAKAENDDDSKRGALERKLTIAEMRLSHTKMDQATQATSSEENVGFAQEELEMAQAQQAQFETLDGPNRQARGELSLKRARDQTAEAAEELAQLEIMYKDQDLQDMTAEFVINRGKRNAERAALSLAVQEKELEALTTHEMPRELRGLQLAVARKTSALAKTKADAEAGKLKNEIAVLNVESDIAELKEQLEKLAEGSK